MKRVGIVTLAATLAVGLPAALRAHAMLNHAEPAVGATVAHPPARVTLWFSDRLEPAFSTIRVTDTQGQRLDRGDVHGLKGSPEALEVSLPPLAPGEYTVTWEVRSTDVHTTHGAYHFRVAK